MTIYLNITVLPAIKSILEISAKSQEYADIIEYIYTATEGSDREACLKCHQTLRHLSENENLLNFIRHCLRWANIIEKNIRFCMPKDREIMMEFVRKIRSLPIYQSLSDSENPLRVGVI